MVERRTAERDSALADGAVVSNTDKPSQTYGW